MPGRQRTARVWGVDHVKTARCDGATCGAAIVWLQFVKSQKKAPFRADFKTLKVEDDGGRPIWVVDLADAHYGTCPHAKEFTKKKPAATGGSKPIDALLAGRDALRRLYRSLSVAEDLQACKIVGARINEALRALGYKERESS